MKQSLLLALQVFSAIPLLAQNYQLLYSHEQRHYQLGEGHLGLEVASVVFDGDSLYTLASHWIQDYSSNDGCHYPDTSAWLCSKVRIAADGTTTLYTFSGDELTLQVQSALNDTWVVYTDPVDEWYVEGTVANHYQDEVLGSQEWLKVIAFQAYDAEGNTMEHWMNIASFTIAENGGLVQASPLGYFPFQSFDLPLQLTLSGVEGQAGVQNLNWFEVFDFEVEDVIHYEEINVFMGEGNIKHYLVTYLSRQDFLPDSIVYEMEIEKWSYEGSGIWNADLTYDTTTVEEITIYANPGFDQLAYTPLVHETELEFMGDFLLLGDYQGFPAKYRPSGYTGFYLFEGFPHTCYLEAIDGTCWGGGNSYYVKCLGMYSFCDNGAGQNSVSLKYFNKQGVEWGKPLSTEDAYTGHRKMLRVYPNPVRESFRLEVSASHYPLSLHVLAADGRQLSRHVLRHPDEEIPVPVGYRGLLLLSATTHTGALMHAKLVVQ